MMKLLTTQELQTVAGGEYGVCEVIRDGTTGLFTAAGTVIGAATTFGLGGVAGGFAGHMVGNAATSVIYDDCIGM